MDGARGQGSFAPAQDPASHEDGALLGECVVAIALNAACTAVGVAIFSNRLGAECPVLHLDSLPVSVESIEEDLSGLKNVYNPSMWLVHPKIVANTPLLEVILCSPSGVLDYYRYHSPKSALWSHTAALNLLCNRLSVRDLYAFGADHSTAAGGAGAGAGAATASGEKDVAQMTYHRLSSVVSLENTELCQAAGALLEHLLSSSISVNSRGCVEVQSLNKIDVSSVLQLDVDTVAALSIFVQETHPNVLGGKGRSKEGLSLFALLDRTRSLRGRVRLHEWLQRPFTDVDRIEARLNGVELMQREENLDWAAQASKHLKKLHDIPAILTRIKKVEATASDWAKFLRSAQALIALAQHVQDFISTHSLLPPAQAAAAPSAAKKAKVLPPGEQDAAFLEGQWGQVSLGSLRANFRSIILVVDEGESAAQDELVVRTGHDQQLDALRTVYANLEQTLREAAEELLAAFPTLDRVVVEYVPQIGFLVSIDLADEHVVAQINSLAVLGLAPDPNPNPGNSGSFEADSYGNPLAVQPLFDLSHSTDQGSFYRTAGTAHLDATIGDIRYLIQDRQRELLVAVEDLLLLQELSWRHAADCAASLDAVMSLGVIARERDFVRPTVSTEPIVAIKDGRHPLQELTVETYISNDTFLDTSRNVAVITGPNSSGKRYVLVCLFSFRIALLFTAESPVSAL